MKLEYAGQEQIAAAPAAVWAFVSDPDKVSRCLPELIEATVPDPTHFEATVRVGLGPVRGKLKFKFELRPDADTRRMTMTATGGGLGSALDLVASADVVPAGTGTILDWRGEAEMRGPVAAVGGRVLDAQAHKLIAQTFANVRVALSG